MEDQATGPDQAKGTKKVKDNGNKNRLVKIRVTEDDEARLKELAEREGLTLSEYLRRRGLRRRAPRKDNSND